MLNPPVQIWGSLEFGVWSLALCYLCYPPMQTPLVCNFHGVLPNIKLSYTQMSSENTHYSAVRIQDSTRFIVEDSVVPVMEPQISLNLKSVPVGLAMYFGETGCQNSRQAQSLTHSSLAPPPRMLQDHQMAPTHLDSITMLVKKLLVGHTRSISGPILRGRDFRLTASFILYERICCLR